MEYEIPEGYSERIITHDNPITKMDRDTLMLLVDWYATAYVRSKVALTMIADPNGKVINLKIARHLAKDAIEYAMQGMEEDNE